MIACDMCGKRLIEEGISVSGEDTSGEWATGYPLDVLLEFKRNRMNFHLCSDCEARIIEYIIEWKNSSKKEV